MLLSHGLVASRHGAGTFKLGQGVVHAAVKHINRRITLRRAHGDASINHAKVMALDKLCAHLVGEESVLEIGRIVDAGREDGDDRLAITGRRRTGCQRSSTLSM